MSEVLCVSHRGIRCGLPSKQVLSAERERDGCSTVQLWRHNQRQGDEHGRVLCVTTAAGPRWISGSDVKLVYLEGKNVKPLPDLLRDFGTLPHVVGLAELGSEIIWLVDARRYHPDQAR